VFSSGVEQSGILVTVAGLGCNQQPFSIGREVVGRVQLLAFMRRQQRAFVSSNISDEDI
jgi:hypothetical protein